MRKIGATLVLACAALLGLSTACIEVHVRPVQPAETRIRSRALFVDEQGRAHDIAVGQKSTAMDADGYQKYLRAMMDSIRIGGRTDLLIRIHGGRTDVDGALDASLWQYDSIMHDTVTAYYPLFVNWESRDLKSYGEHLVYVRQGQRYKRFITGPLLAPVYLVADLGSGIARFPIAAGYQVKQFWWPATDAHVREKEKTLKVLQQTLSSKSALDRRRGGVITIDTGSYFKPLGERVVDDVKSVVFLPFKTGATYFIESAGPEDFANMRRRTATMFRNPSEFKVEARKPAYTPPSGAMSFFLDALDSLVRSDTANGKRYEITLIAHSMGAIVASEMVRTHPNLPFRNIVFMAAASTVRELEVGVLPYLSEHQETQFYDLTLHRLAEVKQQEILDLVPRGSLLSWLDGYLTNPETDMDRVIGRYDNAVLATHIFPDTVRGQIHIKAFGYRDPRFNYGPDLKPARHGEFLDRGVPFWRCEFWVGPKTPCTNGRASRSIPAGR